jgi:hypothetical protein
VSISISNSIFNFNFNVNINNDNILTVILSFSTNFIFVCTTDTANSILGILEILISRANTFNSVINALVAYVINK